MVGRDSEPKVTAYQQGGVKSCCIALHVPGVDPVVRAIWEQIVIPLSGVRVGRRGGRIATGRSLEWALKHNNSPLAFSRTSAGIVWCFIWGLCDTLRALFLCVFA